MVRIIEKLDLNHVDFSFIPSLQCNAHCSFCMYKCNPQNRTELSLDHARLFLKTMDWDRISSWGFYGGEVSINMPLYQKFIDLVPLHIPKFTITNGGWSIDADKTQEFLTFAADNQLGVVISGTEEHKQVQNADVINIFKGVPGIILKDGDDIHPMGRAVKEDWTCSRKCLTHLQPIRLAMFPGGHIILQNCDGAYPLVGNYQDSFGSIFDHSVMMRKDGCGLGLNVNDIMEATC